MSANENLRTIVFSTWNKQGLVRRTRQERIFMSLDRKRIWSKSAVAAFHMKIIACISNNGFSDPPLFILQGQ